MQAYATGSHSMNEIAQTYEIHYVTVSRIVKMKDNFWEMGDLTLLDSVPVRNGATNDPKFRS